MKDTKSPVTEQLERRRKKTMFFIIHGCMNNVCSIERKHLYFQPHVDIVLGEISRLFNSCKQKQRDNSPLLALERVRTPVHRKQRLLIALENQSFPFNVTLVQLALIPGLGQTKIESEIEGQARKESRLINRTSNNCWSKDAPAPSS